jgi:Major royal jelly protein
MKTFIVRLFLIFIASVAVFLGWFYIRYGGHGEAFPELTTMPEYPSDSLSIVAELPEPPGNLAISKEGRIFCTYHAEGRPDVKVFEWVDGKAVPFPSAEWQSAAHGEVFLDAIFNIRIDAQNHLWTLDHGQNGFKTPRLLCFDIETKQLIRRIDIPKEVCGIGSYVQDMQIDTACQTIYVADLSAFGKTPALIVVDVPSGKCRRLLDSHPSLLPEGQYSVVNLGREMRPAGRLYHFHPAFDPIALDRKNKWLYFGPMSGKNLYRIDVAHLKDSSLSDMQLGKMVELYAERPQCDGLTIDNDNHIYVTEIEKGGIGVIDSSRKYRTLVRHPKMRWPDGLSFGPNGSIYVADSDIPDVMLKSKAHMKEQGPYYLFRFRGLAKARAGQ